MSNGKRSSLKIKETNGRRKKLKAFDKRIQIINNYIIFLALKDTGEIWKDIYQKDWAPKKKIADILFVLISMMQAPNMEAPVEAEIAKEYSTNNAQFLKKCKEYIDKFAK